MWSQVRYDLATSWRRTLYNHKTTKRGKSSVHTRDAEENFLRAWAAQKNQSPTEEESDEKNQAEKFSLWGVDGAVCAGREKRANGNVVVGEV